MYLQELSVARLQRGTKIEITKQLSHQAAQTFARWIGCFRVIWNCKVAENRASYIHSLAAKEAGQILPYTKPSQAVAHFITEERPWLKDVPSQIRRNAGTKFVEALNAFFKGLRAAPNFKGFNDKKTCLVTNELFVVELIGGNIQFSFKNSQGSAPFCTIALPISKNMAEPPKMLWLIRRGSRFFISYSYEADFPDVREESVIIDQLRYAPIKVQSQSVIGIDVGIVTPVAASNGQMLGFTTSEIAAIQRKQKKQLQYQKRLARKQKIAKKKGVKSGKNYQKIKTKLADKHTQVASIRNNMAHRVSKQLAETPVEVIVCEKLQIKNMVKRPKAKQDPTTGKWLVNGASRKAGLNKSILNVAWGQLLQYTKYKLRERDKALVFVPAHYSSQECMACGHIAKENRLSQEHFSCIHCGHTDNADHNAACVLKKRFLTDLNTGTFVLPTKTVKRIAIRQKAARVAVSVCGAAVSPALAVGVG